MLTDFPKFPVPLPRPASMSWGNALLEGCLFLPSTQQGLLELALSGETPEHPGMGMSQPMALHLTMVKCRLILT